MALTPRKIFEDFKKKEIDKASAADMLISLIENAYTNETRLESIQILQKIEIKNNKIFSILENLFISDTDEDVRILAANTLKFLFQEKALSPLKWALDHEKSWRFLILIVSILSELNNDESKSILIEKIIKFENSKFTTSLSSLVKTKEIFSFDIKKLAKIVENYVLIKYFEDILKVVNYKVEQGLVTELDLSFIGNNTSGWKVLNHLSEFISVLSHLKKLELRSNRIGKFPDSLFTLTSIKYIDLSHNALYKLSDEIGNLTTLECLDLRFNILTEVPSSMSKLTNLKILDLKQNKLSILPESFGELIALEVLNLHGNKLTELPNSLKNLTSLNILKLGLNNLKFLPEWIKNLNSLKKLGLGGNKSLSNRKGMFKFLPFITELNLYDNNIKELPESIGSLYSLEVLKLPNNQLTELPDSFQNLKSLKKLDLSWNNLASIPEWISSLTSLEDLNLRGINLKLYRSL